MARKAAAGSLKDITITGPSVEMGIGGFAGALKAYQDGTAEVRGLLLGEVATIFECNFCRNVFRSVELFVEHKRLYCSSKFSLVASETAEAQSSSHASTKQKKTEEQKVFDVQKHISTCLADYQKHLPTDRVLFEPELADLPQPVTSQSYLAPNSKRHVTSKPANDTIASTKAKHRDEDRSLNRSSASALNGSDSLKVKRPTPSVGHADSRQHEVPDLRSRRRVVNRAGPAMPSSSAASSVFTKAQKSTHPDEVQETANLPETAELLLHRTGTAKDAVLAWSAANIAMPKPQERQPCVAKSVSPPEDTRSRNTIETNSDPAPGGPEKAPHLEIKQHALATPPDPLEKPPSPEVARTGPSAVTGDKQVQSPNPQAAKARSAPKGTYFSALAGTLNKRARSTSSETKQSAAEPRLKMLKGVQGSEHSSSSSGIPLENKSLTSSKIGVAPITNAATESIGSVKSAGSSNTAKNPSKLTSDTDGLGSAKAQLDRENDVPASFAPSANNSKAVGSEEASPVKRSLRPGPLLSSQLPQKRVLDPFRTIVPTVKGLTKGAVGGQRYIDRLEEKNTASSSKPDAISQTLADTLNGTHDKTPVTGSDNEKRSESEERPVALPGPSKLQGRESQADTAANVPVASNAAIPRVAQEDVNFKAVPVVLSAGERDHLFSRLLPLSETSNEYQCGECGEISSSISYGRAHMVSHMRVVRLICSLCDAGAFFCVDMRMHLMDRHCPNLHLAPKGYVLPGGTLPCMDALKADKLTRLVDPAKKGHAFLTPGKIVSTKSHKPYKPDARIEARILGRTPITRSKSLVPPPVQLAVVPADVFRFPPKSSLSQPGPSS